MNYAGDVTSRECWQALLSDKNAQLVDVRTTAEWSFVGVPDISKLDRSVIFEAWQQFPGMAINQEFAERVQGELHSRGATKGDPVYFLCRSGQRSAAAAAALTAAGFQHAYNVAGGFEGNLDQHQHRGGIDGWKVAGLDWVQK